MKATIKGANAVYLFIAELNGYKTGTEAGKLAYGQQCYLTSALHDTDYSTEAGQSSAHENIWLQRLYADLDKFYGLDTDSPVTPILKARGIASVTKRAVTAHKWTVPIELDASALTYTSAR